MNPQYLFRHPRHGSWTHNTETVVPPKSNPMSGVITASSSPSATGVTAAARRGGVEPTRGGEASSTSFRRHQTSTSPSSSFQSSTSASIIGPTRTRRSRRQRSTTSSLAIEDDDDEDASHRQHPRGVDDRLNVVGDTSRRDVLRAMGITAASTPFFLFARPEPTSAGLLSSAVGDALNSNGGVGGVVGVGLVEYDSPDLDYSFRYPRGWKSLRNHLRRGVVVSDFSTTDKAYVEVFSKPPRGELLDAIITGIEKYEYGGGSGGSGGGGGYEQTVSEGYEQTVSNEGRGVTALALIASEAAVEGDETASAAAAAAAEGRAAADRARQQRTRRRREEEAERLAIRARAVEVLVAPVENDNSGDSKLEVPSMRNVKTLDVGVGGGGGDGDGDGGGADTRADSASTYDYFTFTSDTTTRSGYQVTRRNFAAVKVDARTGLIYALCCSTTTDGFDERKAAMFTDMVRSFVVN